MTRHDSPGAAARPTFRGDVQGLRAIAVLVVVADHAGLPLLPGGFVGVDVFFVISGFLISSLLFREVERDGHVSLRDFYARRARRILPAATLVTLVTVVSAALWVNVVDALEVVTDALWATFFAANIRFIEVGTDYNAQEQLPSPLQHYWSLSVEEQFYLLWPLILIGALWLVARAARRRAGRTTGRTTGGGARAASRDPLPRLTLFWVLLGLGAASFGYGLWVTGNDPTAAYFSTPARAWELAVGAVTALVAHAVARRLDAVRRAALTVAGLAAIAYACLFYSDTTAFPGWAALVPVLGSALVLLAGAGGHEREPWPMRMLAVRPMRVVGDWSYSLYLWHWPLLTLPLLRSGEALPLSTALLAVVVAFVLAALTYRYVETPFRSSKAVPRPRALALYPASIVLIAASCGAASVWGHYRAGEFGDEPAITVSGEFGDAPGKDVSRDPQKALVQASVIAARDGRPIPSDLTPDVTALRDDVPDVGDCDYELDVRQLCPRGEPDADKSLVVLGNSHGRMWIPAFEKIAEREGYTTYYLVKSNCTGADLLVNDLSQGSDVPWTECSDWRDWAFDQIADIDPDLVVVSTSGPNPTIFTDDGGQVGQDDPDRADVVREGYAETFRRLAPLAGRVALLRDVPKNERDPGECLSSGSSDLGDCLFTPLASQEADSDLSIEAAKQTGADVVNPTRWICWQDECPAVIGSTISYRDRGHLTSEYAGDLAEQIGTALGLLPDD